jgi:hypothetical protein
MKMPPRKPALGSLTITILASTLYIATGSYRIASMHSQVTPAPATTSSPRRAARVKGIKNPRINFKDSIELAAQSAEAQSSAVALAAADFDSDGMPDLVTVSADGQITLRR